MSGTPIYLPGGNVNAYTNAVLIGPQGPAGIQGPPGTGSGSTSFTGLTDYSTANIPSLNTPTANAFATKQNVLTAGTGITISGSTISSSATGTSTYAALTDAATVNLPSVNNPLQTALATKQATLTAGSGISISSGTISNTGPTTVAALSDATTYSFSTLNTPIVNALATKQANLTSANAGTGISISSGVISNTQTTTYAGLTDAATVGLPTINTPLQTALAAKQATLTAGAGISISSNTISATGSTTYAGLTDAATVNLPTVNTPLSTALAAKQATLTAGTGISITGTTVANTGPTTVAGLTDATTYSFPTLNTPTVTALAAKQRTDYINVLDYGADPTGVASSSTAFTNALAAARTGSFPTYRVYAPPGEYLFSTTVTISGGVEIFGSSTGATGSGALTGQTMIVCPGTCFTYAAVTNNTVPIYIHDIAFYTSSTNTTMIDFSSTSLINPLFFSNVFFGATSTSNYYSSAINIANNINFTFYRCTITNIASTAKVGIFVAGTATPGTGVISQCNFNNISGISTNGAYTLNVYESNFINTNSNLSGIIMSLTVANGVRNLMVRNSFLSNANISINPTTFTDGGIVSVEGCRGFMNIGTNIFFQCGTSSGTLSAITSQLSIINNQLIYANTTSAIENVLYINQAGGLLISGNTYTVTSATGNMSPYSIDTSCSNGEISNNLIYATAGGSFTAGSNLGTNVNVNNTLPSTYAGLSDAATVNLPTVNNPLSTALAAKQGTLTAGTGISISSGTISNTGPTTAAGLTDITTYSFPTLNTPLVTALAAKQRIEFINVMDYGADPTGAANSSTAFTNAIAAALAGTVTAQPCLRVYVPPGTYTITSSIAVSSPIEIFGTSSGTNNYTNPGGYTSSGQSIITSNVTTFSFTGTTTAGASFYIHDLVFVATAAATPGALNFQTSTTTSVSEFVRMENLSFSSVNTTSYFTQCISLDATTSFSLKSCNFINTSASTHSGVGIDQFVGGSNGYVSNCYFNGYTGFTLNKPYSLTITDTIFTGLSSTVTSMITWAFTTAGTRNLNVRNCTFNNSVITVSGWTTTVLADNGKIQLLDNVVVNTSTNIPWFSLGNSSETVTSGYSTTNLIIRGNQLTIGATATSTPWQYAYNIDDFQGAVIVGNVLCNTGGGGILHILMGGNTGYSVIGANHAFVSAVNPAAGGSIQANSLSSVDVQTTF